VFKQRLVDALNRDFGDAPLFVLKDPRLCILAPLWLSLLAGLDITPLCVIPVRNPFEIAASLNKRNSFSEEKSLLLWLKYFLSAEESTRGLSRTFVLYETLLRDWRGAIAKISSELCVSWPRQSHRTDLEIERFLSADLRHHVHENAETIEKSNVAGWIKTAFAWAIQAAEHPPAQPEDLDTLRSDRKTAEQVYMPLLVGQEFSISGLMDDVRRLTEMNQRLTDERNARDTSISTLSETVRQLTEERDDLLNATDAARQLTDERERLIGERTCLISERERLAEELERLVDANQALMQEASSLAARIDDLEDEIQISKAELSGLQSHAEGIANTLQARDHQLVEALQHRDLVLGSTLWRATQPVRQLAHRLPPPVRRTMRRAVRATYWTVTLQFGRRYAEWQAVQTARALAPNPPAPEPLAPAPISPTPATLPKLSLVPDLLAAHFPALQPYPCFPVTGVRPRLSLVTDGVGPFRLFGGVGTAIILGALLANRLAADLRIVSRREPPDAAPIREVLLCNGIALDGALEVAMAPLDGSVDLPVTADEIFLTTSWWTTRATLAAATPSRIVALVQEDERMFYPQGDERLRCAETLLHPGLATVVNTEMLFRHLLSGREPLANLAQDGIWFEPAFPARGEPRPKQRQRQFFFYARPNNDRNLFWRGIEALHAAVAEGLFPAEEWEMHWIGRDVPEITLPRGIVPRVRPHLAWGDYQKFIASVDAGFVLMDTPHPSYPPLDLAAAGAAVLTNTHPGKETLNRYSDNILLAPPSVEGLVEGLWRLQALAKDDPKRARHREEDRIERDWTAALEPVVSRLAARLRTGT
jgi:hypothetical protein